MKPIVDQKTLEADLVRLLGQPLVLTPVSEGEESRAFALSVGGEELIVRIHPTDYGFAKDAVAAGRFASVDLPIPRIVDHGILDSGLCYCLSQRAPGKTLQDLDPDELRPVLAPVARVMNAMTQSDVGGIDGCGPFDADGYGAYVSWRTYLLAIAEPTIHDWSRLCGGVVPMRISRLLELIVTLAEHCPEMRGLVHGDFGSNNVLAEGTHITGIIDWSEAMVGDPLYDLANILFWRPWLACMEQQALYFEQNRPELLVDKRRLVCYQVRIGLSEVFDNLSNDHRPMAEWLLKRCEAVVESR